MIPRAAVHEGGSVWVVTDGRLRKQVVVLGGEQGDQVVVREGLLGGEAVVTVAEGELAEGLAVEVAAPD